MTSYSVTSSSLISVYVFFRLSNQRCSILVLLYLTIEEETTPLIIAMPASETTSPGVLGDFSKDSESVLGKLWYWEAPMRLPKSDV